MFSPARNIALGGARRTLGMCRACVRVLLFMCRPSAIARFVIAIVVDSLNRQLTWSTPHVSEERSEAVAPAIADLNSARSIVTKLRAFRVVAALNHRVPHMIFNSRTQSMLEPWLSAPARPRHTDPQVADKDFAFVTTGAATQQESKTMSPWGFANNGPVEYGSAWFHWSLQWVDIRGSHGAKFTANKFAYYRSA